MKDTMTLRLEIELDEDVISWKDLRDAIQRAIDIYVNGARFLSINTGQCPDPYLFDDPDDLPEGLE